MLGDGAASLPIADPLPTHSRPTPDPLPNPPSNPPVPDPRPTVTRHTAGVSDPVPPDPVLPDPVLPDPVLVVLIGAAGSGKSTWAAGHFASAEIVASDALRAVVGTGESDLSASADAFELLHRIVEARLGRRLRCCVDTVGTDVTRRRALIDAARRHGVAVHAVVLDTPAELCRSRKPVTGVEAGPGRRAHPTAP